MPATIPVSATGLGATAQPGKPGLPGASETPGLSGAPEFPGQREFSGQRELPGKLAHPDVSGGFSAYVHIPFCRARCGYCDFNTYTKLNFGHGAALTDFPQTLATEIELSARMLDTSANQAALRSIFFGGGTPTMLEAAQLGGVVEKLRATFGLEPGAEITTEANPETVHAEKLEALRKTGINRFSFGMQSAVPEVLATLDRKHTPGQVERVARWARELGVSFSVDLIYGAPGETMAQWEESVDAAIALEPQHISAYGLIVEPGTKMGQQIKRGLLAAPDPDMQADKYELADSKLSAAGYQWYEISNWAKPGYACRHNLYYWENASWWGYGPGAHSHINGERFWNVKHPLAYAQRLETGALPVQGREILGAREQLEEHIMLGIRTRHGIEIPAGSDPNTIDALRADGLLSAAALASGKLVLTRRGRLLADTVTRVLWDEIPDEAAD
ncbi:oxygen-independent coproporphyrinogen III oxidase [Actinobaculum suis]|uniref:Heme chaperone HemW n=1 Tax=Actinobaculum suis TaxID=1657 RepID=A0A7Z8Y8S8_9ACTO|nr:radical SAM family heme chaperone HemW [Actinobaculum suis]VDG76379.1 oxygen-independent coproporphyrinogen III oxidase [Actinobaculum suis]